ncbi:MAG TPA: hypothetical protein H9902_11475 [Candidatus Stackebrandtia faecavium]|nr:hypothetical protein [Candidatus Stackebrandtia faecavium]
MTYPPPPGQPGADGSQGHNNPGAFTRNGPGQPPAGDGFGGSPPQFSAQPPPPQPHGSKKTTGWIIGGVVGVIVVSLVAVSILFFTGTFDNETGTTASEGKESGKENTDDHGGDDAEKHKPREYKPIDDLCGALNFDAAEKSYGEVMETVNDTNTTGDRSQSTCMVAIGDYSSDDKGQIHVTAYINGNSAAAKAYYKSKIEAPDCDSRKELEGAWEQGSVLTKSADTPGACMIGKGDLTGVYVLDGTMLVEAQIDLEGDLADGNEPDLLVSLTEAVLKASAA